MTLQIKKGRIKRAQKSTIYGAEGLGKSTLASQFPNPIFLDFEGGTAHLDVARIDEIKTWEDVQVAIKELASSDHSFRTLVIDTADWAEKLLADFILRKHNKTSLEDFGFGKGFVLLAEEFSRFLLSLEPLIQRGIHVVFLAHATIKKFESPEQAGSYDRFELKLSRQVSPLLKEWSDHLLFANFVTRVAESSDGKRRGVGGKERIIFTTHSAAYDAKNRCGLAEKIPMTIDSLAPIIGDALSPKSEPAPKSMADQLAELFSGREEAVRAFLINRKQITAEGSWGDVSSDYAARILQDPDRFFEAVQTSTAQTSNPQEGVK